jgi:DNA polymerase
MFVGEAPGFSEDAQGRPFVGDAGKFLETVLSEIGFSRGDVFICNVLKCRPPRNRGPQQVEIETCTPFLDRQIEIIKPKVIVTLGNHSTAYVFSKANLLFEGITRVHGRFLNANILGLETLLFPTFHPAAALYNPKYKDMLVQDFRLLKKDFAKLNF